MTQAEEQLKEELQQTAASLSSILSTISPYKPGATQSTEKAWLHCQEATAQKATACVTYSKAPQSAAHCEHYRQQRHERGYKADPGCQRLWKGPHWRRGGEPCGAACGNGSPHLLVSTGSCSACQQLLIGRSATRCSSEQSLLTVDVQCHIFAHCHASAYDRAIHEFSCAEI